MAKLSDKQKADAILGDVEEETPVETTNEEKTDLEPEEQEATNESETVEEPVEEAPEEEKPAESEEEAAPETETFTKQFPNLKGETLAEYTPELEKAYDNSFKEALRLNKALEEANATIASMRAQAPVQPTQPDAAQAAPQLPLQEAINGLPEIQRIKAQDTQAMFAAFDDFAKQYPQAREQQPFDDFTKVSGGVQQALNARLGRIPTYPELFNAIAGTLQWQPTTPTPGRDAAIKQAGASSHTNSATLAPSRRTKVSDAQVDAYLKMFTSKTREDAVKELSEVV